MCLAFRRRLILTAAFLALAVGSGLFALPAYRHFKERRAVQRAQCSLASGELRKASLSARQALAINPTNLDACLVMAQVAESVSAPQALDWRRRIAELAPTLEHKLEVAQTALALGSLPIAAQALKDLSPTSTSSADYHVLAAQLALKLNRPDDAELHFASAAGLQPANPLHRLNLSVLQLLSTNEMAADAARVALKSLLGDTNVATLALRSLMADALKHRQFTSADAFCKSLLANPRATFSDQLQRLTILHEANWPEFEPALTVLQSKVVTNALITWSLGTWMNRNGLAGRALEWLTNCAVQVQTNPPVPIALADSYVECRQWAGLESFLQPQVWPDLEFARMALLARATAAQQNQIAAEAYWRLAIHQAGSRLGPLTTLLGLATAWNLPETRANLLAMIVEKFPRERWAYRELVPLCVKQGNTRALNRLSGLLASMDPQDIEAGNNFAGTCLLLKVNLGQAHRTARENLARKPEDPVLIATYAYSLHLQGRTGEGVAALETLTAESLRESNTALYYGVLLGATHQLAKAKSILAVVELDKLLPEERELVSEVEQEN
jgi:predicted Zn-dependent protease